MRSAGMGWLAVVPHRAARARPIVDRHGGGTHVPAVRHATRPACESASSRSMRDATATIHVRHRCPRDECGVSTESVTDARQHSWRQ